MDYVALAFYACVCAILSVFAPRLGTVFVRFAVGAGVGIVAAAILPSLRGVLGA